MAKRDVLWTVVGGILVTFAVIGFSEYRRCSTAEGATVERTSDQHPSLAGQLNELAVENRVLTRRLEQLEADVEAMTAVMNSCHVRTDDLHDVLKALLPTMPGRARLPLPNGPWEPWPAVGSHREDYRYLPHEK